MSKKEKLDRMMKAFESLDDDAFDKWLEDQPGEYGELFYELMFPPSNTETRSQPKAKSV